MKLQLEVLEGELLFNTVFDNAEGCMHCIMITKRQHREVMRLPALTFPFTALLLGIPLRLPLMRLYLYLCSFVFVRVKKDNIERLRVFLR